MRSTTAVHLGGHGGKLTGLQAYAWDLMNDADGDGRADAGASVLAVAPGVVVDVQSNQSGNTLDAWKNFSWDSGDPPPSVGNFVVVDHEDGTYETYWHLSSVFVTVGFEVVPGMALGRLGNRGNSSAPHLHFDIRKNWDVGYPGSFKEYPSVKVRLRDKNHACWRPRTGDPLKSSNVLEAPVKAYKPKPKRGG